MSYEEFMTDLVLLGFVVEENPIYCEDSYYVRESIRIFISHKFQYIRTRDRYGNRKTFNTPICAIKYITYLLDPNKQRK